MGGGAVTSGQVWSVLLQNCDFHFHGFLVQICTSLLCGTPIFFIVFQDGLSAYSEADKASASPRQESGQAEDLSRDTSIQPDSSQGVTLGTTSSVPTDPARSDPSRYDAPAQATQPIQEDSQDSSRFLPPPPPPEEPYGTSIGTGRAKEAQRARRRGAASDMTMLPPFYQPLPVSFLTFDGPVRTPAGRASLLILLGYVCLCPGTSTGLHPWPGCG